MHLAKFCHRVFRVPMAKSENNRCKFFFNTKHGYLNFQKDHGYQLQNPAIYLVRPNILAAGDELAGLNKGLAEIRVKNDAIREKYKLDMNELPKRIQEFTKELENQGRSKQEIKQLLSVMRFKLNADLERKNWNSKKRRKTMDKFLISSRTNFSNDYRTNRFMPIWKTMFIRATYTMYRGWLNEGLAQIFEEGVIEAGTLRLDIPSRSRLTKLQNDLQSDARISLEDVLTAEPSMFLVNHQSDAKTSERLYLYSWGLAYYLTVHEPVLQAKAARSIRRDRIDAPKTDRAVRDPDQ